MKNMIVRLILTAIGLMTCGVGIGAFLFSNLGVDPASVFQLGIANQLSISYGTASALMNVLIIIIVFFLEKKYINIATFMAIFLIGYTADYSSYILDMLITIELNLFIRLFISVIGCVIMSIGIPIYIFADLGVGAVDLVSEIITERSRYQYRIVRVVMDSSFVMFGYLLGGTVGIGTVIAVFLTGPIVQHTRPIIRKLLLKLKIMEGILNEKVNS